MHRPFVYVNKLKLIADCEHAVYMYRSASHVFRKQYLCMRRSDKSMKQRLVGERCPAGIHSFGIYRITWHGVFCAVDFIKESMGLAENTIRAPLPQ